MLFGEFIYSIAANVDYRIDTPFKPKVPALLPLARQCEGIIGAIPQVRGSGEARPGTVNVQLRFLSDRCNRWDAGL